MIEIEFSAISRQCLNVRIAGGSNQTASVAAAVAAAVEKAHRELLVLAGDDFDSPLSDAKYDQIEVRDNGLFSKKGGRKAKLTSQS